MCIVTNLCSVMTVSGSTPRTWTAISVRLGRTAVRVSLFCRRLVLEVVELHVLTGTLDRLHADV